MIVRMVRRRFPFVAALPAMLAVGSAPALAADRTGAFLPVGLKTSAVAARVAFAPVVRVIDGDTHRRISGFRGRADKAALVASGVGVNSVTIRLRFRAACKILIDSERRKNTQASSDIGARQLVRF